MACNCAVLGHKCAGHPLTQQDKLVHIKIKSPAKWRGSYIKKCKYYSLTFNFPFTFAITSSAMLLGAGE
jgi:hypothetical protein